MASKFWNINNEEKLIDLVKENRALWDKSLREFKDSGLKLKLFEDIGKRLGTTGEICSKRWGNMRTTFGKNHNESSNQKSGAPAKTVTWPHMTRMKFLKDSIRRRTTKGKPAAMKIKQEPADDAEQEMDTINDESDGDLDKTDDQLPEPGQIKVEKGTQSSKSAKIERKRLTQCVGDTLAAVKGTLDTLQKEADDPETQWWQVMAGRAKLLKPRYKEELKVQMMQIIHQYEIKSMAPEQEFMEENNNVYTMLR